MDSRRLGISLDGADATTHDAFRGWEGSFQRTLEMLANARRLGLAVQVNTTITAASGHTAAAAVLHKLDLLWIFRPPSASIPGELPC
jgi:MoaA/NifB/PqqE/SkfB family radical SAM enzyme